MMGPHILVAPAGSRFSAEAGSEDGWLYDIVTGVRSAEPEFEFTCITGESQGSELDGIRVVAVGRRSRDELDSFALPFRIARETRAQRVSRPFDLVHHGLPFAVGRTFSVLGARSVRRGVPFVVGPVQTPLEWTGSDERIGNLAGVSTSPLRATAAALARSGLPLVARGLGHLSAWTLQSASRVVAVSPAASQLLTAAGVRPERVRVIPPPVRLPIAHTRSWVAPTSTLRLLTAGYLIERKRTVDIVEVIARLAAGGELIQLDVAGDGPALSRIRQVVEQVPGGNAIHLHGWLSRERLMELYDSAHVYISMSRAESWGHAVAEAMARGLVVVSSPNIGARTMAALGAPFRLLPTADRWGLFQMLSQLSHSDRAQLRREGESAAKWAAEYLGAPVIARSWSRVYREALDDVNVDRDST